MSITTVPVTLGFDKDRVIGHMVIDTDFLPPTPRFCFSLAYRAEQFDCPAGVPPSHEHVTQYRLEGIGLVSDADYVGFLKQTGQLPAGS